MTISPPPNADSSNLPFKSIGPYEVRSRIGGGGMGNVFLAEHRYLKTLVAIKILAPHVAGSPLAADRFRQEMEAIGKLKHPNIIAASNADEVNGVHFLVMEYVKGSDLRVLLSLHTTFSIANACELTRQTATALACIAEHGMVHRDIKPSNLLLGEDGLLRVLDLGVARLKPTAEGGSLTDTGQLMGTGDYIAPEQGADSHGVDIHADIYSLGCTLYTMLRGVPPFSDPRFDNIIRKIRAHEEEPVPPIRQFRPDVPIELSNLLDGMLRKNPAERLGSPAVIAAELTKFTAGASLQALFAPPANKRETATYESPHQHAATISHATRSTVPFRADRLTMKAAPHVSRRWFVAGGALLAVGSGIGLWQALRNSPAAGGLSLGSMDNVPGSDEERSPFEPGIWYDLLDRPPKVLLWSDNPANSRRVYDAEKRELWVSCTDRAMLELAKVEGIGFDFELTIFQNPWVGGVGLFFRGREKEVDRATMDRADILSLERFSAREDPDKARLNRGSMWNFRNASQASPSWDNSDLIPRPLHSAHRLRIRVDQNGLQRIQWDDLEVGAKLLDPQPFASNRIGANGSIGLYVENNSTVFRFVRLRLYPLTGESP